MELKILDNYAFFSNHCRKNLESNVPKHHLSSSLVIEPISLFPQNQHLPTFFLFSRDEKFENNKITVLEKKKMLSKKNLKNMMYSHLNLNKIGSKKKNIFFKNLNKKKKKKKMSHFKRRKNFH